MAIVTSLIKNLISLLFAFVHSRNNQYSSSVPRRLGIPPVLISGESRHLLHDLPNDHLPYGF